MTDLPSARSALIHPHPGEDEPQLQQAAASLLGLLDQEQLGVWCWPLAHHRLYLSDAARQLLGLLNPVPDAPQSYLERVHPDDQARVEQALNRLINGLSLETALHHRVQHRDGHMRWLQLSGQRQSLANGELQLIGLLRESRAAQTYAIPQQAKEQGFQHLFQAMPEALLLLDLHAGCVLDVNPNFERLFGWSAAQVLGRTGKDIGIWANSEQPEQLFAAMLSQPLVLNQPVQLFNQTRQRIHGLLSWQQLQLDQQDCLLVSFTDTSKQLQAEAALRASENKFAASFRSTPDSMIITQRETGTLLQINPAFERQFGWTSTQAIGRTTLEIGLWREPLERQTMLTALADDGRLEHLEVEFSHRDGSHSTNLLYGAECLIDGQVCLALTLRDITHQRQQEQALLDSQERLQLALESAELGLWDWHLPSNQLFASARAASLHGLANETYNGPLESFFTYIPLEDQRTAVAAFKQLRDGHLSNTRTTYCAQHADGSQHFLEGSAKLYRDAQDQPERMVGVLRDITARTLREQALAASEEKFASLFQGSPEPICVTRLNDAAFIEINPSFTQAFGWQPEQIVGKNALEIDFWLDLEVRKQLGKQLMAQGQLNNVIAQFRAQNGQLLTCIIAARLIRVGRQRCMITTFRDITAQQATERLRILSEEKFAKAFHASPDAISISELRSGRFLEVNQGFCRLTGYQLDEVIGRTSLELNSWDPGQRQYLIETLARDGHARNLEMLARDRDGQPMTVQVSVQPITIDGNDCLLLIARDISDLKQAQAQIEHLAYHDSLTNLPNRSLLMDRLSQQIALLKRHNLRGALLFIDLDHFKHINDSLGHPLGDAVLKMVAARLEVSVRQEDTVARLGGDEFVVLISGLEGTRAEVTRHVREVANKLRQLLSEPMLLDGHRLQVTPSIGMVLIPDHGDTPADLLKRADIALYRAKASGRNTLQMFRKNMQEAASARLRLEHDLRLALARGEFELYLQPQVDARYGQIVGAEALLRWNHPQHGPQSPIHFIEVLEESGLIVEVGDWVLTEACHLCAQLLDEGLINAGQFSLCVNISPRQFRQPGFVERVERSLSASHLNQSLLTLEITEGIVIHNLDDTIAKMLQLKKLGISFAMDDFGTGYSSLTYLKRLPVDILKIDQSFVRDATQNPNDAEIIRAIVAMAQSLGLEVIAEGVEHEEQLALLQQQGCHLYQGYLYSQPLPLPTFRALLAHAKQRPPLN
ncbi:MAG: sensory box protein [Pseudomonadales bacterium RIFCSPLOWO2_12_59_9]|nr:MAG: sensory box protein [Pseudomonadales bacterium RIFCSPLOWO2_12_59_9]